MFNRVISTEELLENRACLVKVALRWKFITFGKEWLHEGGLTFAGLVILVKFVFVGA